MPGPHSRRSVRVISARVCDVAGVLTVEIDARTGTVRVTGDADPTAVRAAIVAAGFAVEPFPTR